MANAARDMARAAGGLHRTLALRPASIEDWPTIDRWLGQDEARRWWGSRSAAQASVLAALDAPMGLCSIVVADGQPAGYAQALEATAVGEADPHFDPEPLLPLFGAGDDDPNGDQAADDHGGQQIGGDDPSVDLSVCYRVDAFIGERALRGQGIGVGALRLVTDEVFATTLATAVVAVVPLRNEAAVRAHEKAGFGWVRIVDDPLHGPCWLMRKTRA